MNGTCLNWVCLNRACLYGLFEGERSAILDPIMRYEADECADHTAANEPSPVGRHEVDLDVRSREQTHVTLCQQSGI